MWYSKYLNLPGTGKLCCKQLAVNIINNELSIYLPIKGHLEYCAFRRYGSYSISKEELCELDLMLVYKTPTSLYPYHVAVLANSSSIIEPPREGRDKVHLRPIKDYLMQGDRVEFVRINEEFYERLH